MKRLVTFLISIVFLGYFLAFLAAFEFLRIKQIPILGPIENHVRKFVGLGGLFIKSEKIANNKTVYRLFDEGKWSAWRRLEEPLFEHYLSTGSIAALKHAKLDRKLIIKLLYHHRNKSQNILQSKELKLLSQHIFFAHHANKVTDSLELKVYSEKVSKTNPKMVLHLKYKPSWQ